MGKYHTAIMKSLYAKKRRAFSADASEATRSQSREDGTCVWPKTAQRAAKSQKQVDPMSQTQRIG